MASDSDRIDALEEELRNLKCQLDDLSLALRDLSRTFEARKATIQSILEDLENSISLIFKHVPMPGVTYNPIRTIIR